MKLEISSIVRVSGVEERERRTTRVTDIENDRVLLLLESEEGPHTVQLHHTCILRTLEDHSQL